MQLWQKNSNNLSICGLRKKISLKIREVILSGQAGALRFLPVQYLPAFQDFFSSNPDVYRDLDILTEKVFWLQLSGGHPELRMLFEEHGFRNDKQKSFLFGHEISSLSGFGRSAAVYTTTEHYALKVVLPENKLCLKNEFSLLSMVKHRHIVEVHAFYESKYGAGMLLEKLDVPSGDRQGYFRALSYLHGQGLCHGDIRYGNLGTSRSGCAKLLDFGSCFHGTPQFMKKECFDLKTILDKYLPDKGES